MTVEIRKERPEDIDAIRYVTQQAFGQAQESHIVDALRSHNAVLLSLVAIVDNQVVGHILYSPVTLHTEHGTVMGAGLAPMAVLPEFQRQGIGSQLVENGNRMLADTGCSFIIVLGHPQYYPRFGFEPASRYHIKSEWEVPDEAFMIRILDNTYMQGASGLAKYREEFSSVD